MSLHCVPLSYLVMFTHSALLRALLADIQDILTEIKESISNMKIELSALSNRVNWIAEEIKDYKNETATCN